MKYRKKGNHGATTLALLMLLAGVLLVDHGFVKHSGAYTFFGSFLVTIGALGLINRDNGK